MKKLLIAMVLAAALVLALATTALADFGPHGGFTATTDKCASCHRAHSAQDPSGMLLIAPVADICLSCHDGNGAYTDVLDGVYNMTSNGATPSVPGASTYDGTPESIQWQGHGATGYGLFGGGFANAAMAHTFNGMDGYDKNSVKPLPSATTSTHNYDGTTLGTVWGAGDIGPLSSTQITLECTSCHDPHGNAGKTGNVPAGAPMASYRLLRFEPKGSNGFEAISLNAATPAVAVILGYWNSGNAASLSGITVPDTAATNKWYTPNNDATADPSVALYRARFDTATGEWLPWSSYVAARGDYAGRNYVYQAPAIQGTVAGGYLAVGNAAPYVGLVTTMMTCKNGAGALPPLPTTNLAAASYTAGVDYYLCPVPATPLTPFNNSTVNANGSGGAAGRARLGYWCSTCHDRYLANSGSRTADTGDAYYTFRHNSSSTTPCVDCHVAHGTASVMTQTNLHYPGASLTSGSILLKMDERSVCLKCHGHDINFGYIPAP